MRFKKILIPIDFSEPAREALRAASQLAADTGASLVLLHVLQPTMYGYASSIEAFPAGVVTNVMADAERGLADWKHEATSSGARQVEAVVKNGTPWHEIVETLRSDPAFDLVMLGTHGRTGLSHVLLGSVAEKVIRHAPCTAMVVRARS